MKRILQSKTLSTGLAIFSMFFGAGNLMFPIKVGTLAGQHNSWAMAGFILTSVCLPLIGLISIILFNGDYISFFNRLGAIPGFMMTAFCMIIIGPLIAMPRIVTLSHIMISPFIGNLPLIPFSILFLIFTFLGTYRESRIIDLLGTLISPALVISLFIIIGKGLWYGGDMATSTDQSALTIFWESLKAGYSTLDVIGAIFFSSIVLTILKKNLEKKGNRAAPHSLAILGFKAGLLGTGLLALVYIGLSYLGTFYGYGLADVNEGEIFSIVSFRVLGPNAAIIIAIAVLMACYSTIIALAAVFAEYLQNHIAQKRISYITALILCLSATLITSNFGLTQILTFSKPIIEIGYPALVVLMLLNVAYKLFDFKPVVLPVLITLLISIISYLI